MLRSRLLAAAFAVPAALLLALLVTPSSAVQRNVTIQQIQDTTAVGHVIEGSTDTVTVEGVVTGADTRGSGYGFYIQDPAGGNFSGVLIFTGGANVFADSGYARGDLIRATGRVIEFQGGTEVTSRTGGAFDAPPTTTKIGTSPLPPFITLANYGQLSETAAYGVAEKYEGVLVQTSNGKNVRYPIFASGTSGSFLTASWLVIDNLAPITNPMDTIQVDGFTLANPQSNAPALGVVATSLKGIAYQGSRGYRLQLRDGADIVVPSPPTLLNAWATSNSTIRILFDRALDEPTAETTGNYSRTTLKAVDSAVLVGGAPSQTVDLTTVVNPQIPGESEGVTAANVKSSLGVAMSGPSTQSFRAGITPITQVQTNFTVNPPFHPAPSDSSQYTFEQVTVRGIMTAKDGQLYYLQNGTGINPSSALAIFAPINGMAEGDDVTASGTVIEFGSASQITEYSGLDYQFENATGVALPAPVVASPGSIGPLTGAEPFPGERYEAMLVRLQNVTVVQDSLPNGMFLVQGSGGTGDTLRVDDTMFRQDILFGDGVGILVSRLDGVINDAFGQYTIQPRRQDDIVAEPVGVTPTSLAFALRSITPTPASFARGGVVINFAVPSEGKVSARIYDVNGRLVAAPANDVSVTAGPQSLSFDGKGTNGTRLGSGIFFVQLQFGNRVATGKLVVTE